MLKTLLNDVDHVDANIIGKYATQIVQKQENCPNIEI